MVNQERLWSAAACCRSSGVEIGSTRGVAIPGTRQEVGGWTFNFQLSTLNSDLLGFLRSHAVQCQDVRQSHNTFKVVNVGAAYNQQ